MSGKHAVAALVLVLVFSIALMAYTKMALERLAACGANPVCHVAVVWEYTLVVITAVIALLIAVDAVLRLGEVSGKRISIYCCAAAGRMGERA